MFVKLLICVLVTTVAGQATWSQILLSGANATSDSTGYRLALDATGSTIVYGNSLADVFILSQIGPTTWIEQTSISEPGMYKLHLTTDGNVLALGALGNSMVGDFGQVSIRVKEGTANWPVKAQLTPTWFFQDSAMSQEGNMVAAAWVGYGGQTGGVDVWQRDTSDSSYSSWSSSLTLSPSNIIGTFDQARLGHNVVLSATGKYLATGGAGDNNFQGAVWVFTLQDNSSWSVTSWSQQKLVANGGSWIGSVMALSAAGDLLACSGQSSVWVFQRLGETWSEVSIPAPVANSGFGTSLSFSGDGSRLAVGAVFGDKTVYVYHRVGSTANNWTQEMSGHGEPFTLNMNQGYSTALSTSGDLLVTGTGTFQGYYFYVFVDSSAAPSPMPTSTSTRTSSPSTLPTTSPTSSDSSTAPSPMPTPTPTRTSTPPPLPTISPTSSGALGCYQYGDIYNGLCFGGWANIGYVGDGWVSCAYACSQKYPSYTVAGTLYSTACLCLQRSPTCVAFSETECVDPPKTTCYGTVDCLVDAYNISIVLSKTSASGERSSTGSLWFYPLVITLPVIGVLGLGLLVWFCCFKNKPLAHVQLRDKDMDTGTADEQRMEGEGESESTRGEGQPEGTTAGSTILTSETPYTTATDEETV